MSTDIKSLIPKKRGKLLRSQEDQLLLMNDSGKIFSTNKALVTTWQLCMGDKSVDQVCQGLEKSTASDALVIDKDPMHFIQKLESAELIVLENKRE